jgi:hypothetical protein
LYRFAGHVMQGWLRRIPSMFAYVLPVRHPQNARSYPQIEELLRQTLASLKATRGVDFRVIVNCNKALEDETDERIVFNVLDFPPPGQGKASEQSALDMRKDKSSKLTSGFLKAIELGATYGMVVDADDFVHRDLAAFCLKDRNPNGYYIDKGLTWRHGGQLVAARAAFNMYCGTSHVLHMDRFRAAMIGTPPKDASQDEVLAAIDEDFRMEVLAAHRRATSFCAEKGMPLVPVPFPAAVWRNGSEESRSGIRFADNPRLPSRAEVAAFSLPVSTSLTARASSLATEMPFYWAKALGGKLKRAVRN